MDVNGAQVRTKDGAGGREKEKERKKRGGIQGSEYNYREGTLKV